MLKNVQLILTFSTQRQIPWTRVLYALRRVKFEGSSMGMKPFLQKITSSRVEDLSRPRSKAPYCKHETTNRITWRPRGKRGPFQVRFQFEHDRE